MSIVNIPKGKSDEEQLLEDQYLLDESFDELQTEENWREFNFPSHTEDYYN